MKRYVLWDSAMFLRFSVMAWELWHKGDIITYHGHVCEVVG